MDEMEPLREEAIRALSAAFATDRLSLGQFETRLVQVRQAPNRATLDAILADLMPSEEFVLPTGLVAVTDHTGVAGHEELVPVEPAELLRIKTVMGSSNGPAPGRCRSASSSRWCWGSSPSTCAMRSFAPTCWIST